MIKQVRPGSGIDLGSALDGRMQKLSNNDDGTVAMARGSYGYGSWHAPYWFIGPEQGVGRHEKGNPEESLKLRVRKWEELGSLDLNDCREFHRRIREMRWHFKEPRVDLQPTWRPLLLAMMEFLERSGGDDDLRHYQARMWGASAPWTKEAGETCVIELSVWPLQA